MHYLPVVNQIPMVHFRVCNYFSFAVQTLFHLYFQATVSVISNNDCQKFHDQNEQSSINIFNLMFCAGKPGMKTCVGDSGGPVVQNVDGHYELVGTISGGINCDIQNTYDYYGRATHPTVEGWWRPIVGPPSCNRL